MESDGFSGLLLTVLITLAASSGFWTWVIKRDTRRSATTRLLLGLAHDRIIFLGMRYLDRGFITKDEFEDFHKYLWEPYSTFGGNGLAEKIFKDMQALPIFQTERTNPPIKLQMDEETKKGVYNEH